MRMDIKIRQVALEDAKEIASVGIKTWQTSYRGIFPGEKLDDMTWKDNTVKWTNIIREELKNPDVEMFVVEDSHNKIIGYAGGGIYTTDSLYDCEIARIYIIEEYQHIGIGRRLFNKLLDFFLSKNWNTMIIWVLKDSVYRSFYDKMGGTPSKTMMYEKWGTQYDLVGYVWKNISLLQEE
jgi:GNAT superfamily N-acetyltransferase